MKKQAFLLLFLVATAILTSCNSRLNKKELIDFVHIPENGLIKSGHYNGVHTEVKYLPTDLIIERFVRNYDGNRLAKIDELKLKYEKYLYFELSFTIDNQDALEVVKNRTNLYGKMVNHFSFGMNNNIFLTNFQNDTLLMVDCTSPPAYGLAKSKKVLCVFKKKRPFKNSRLKLTIKEFGLYTGNIQFRFNTNDISKVPALDFNL